MVEIYWSYGKTKQESFFSNLGNSRLGGFGCDLVPPLAIFKPTTMSSWCGLVSGAYTGEPESYAVFIHPILSWCFSKTLYFFSLQSPGILWPGFRWCIWVIWSFWIWYGRRIPSNWSFKSGLFFFLHFWFILLFFFNFPLFQHSLFQLEFPQES